MRANELKLIADNNNAYERSVRSLYENYVLRRMKEESLKGLYKFRVCFSELEENTTEKIVSFLLKDGYKVKISYSEKIQRNIIEVSWDE